jgi:hypothetical protein
VTRTDAAASGDYAWQVLTLDGAYPCGYQRVADWRDMRMLVKASGDRADSVAG